MKQLPLLTTLALATLTLAACGTSSSSTGTGSVDAEPEIIPVVTTEIMGVGTEPFWAFQFSGTDLTWSEPGNSDMEETDYIQFNQTLSGETMVYTNGDITIMADFLPCSDGMSDTTYPLTVTVQKDGQTLNGCGTM
ncbi:MAG: hypothetical protein H6766_00535 [Candidatus Peribacteria bacterium]|nr:MAG: hypothetical protein H6766_00535 [Candidatus Peribacteria bacterium]